MLSNISVHQSFSRDITKPFSLIIFFIYGVGFGFGTNFSGSWYYPVRGIGLIDFILVAHCFLIFIQNYGAYLHKPIRKEIKVIVSLVGFFVFWLLLSSMVNSYRYGIEMHDIFAILKLLYFAVIILFVSNHVEKYGYSHILYGFVVGVVVIFCQDFFSLAQEHSAKYGIRLLLNPNVIGALLGIGVYLCSLGVISGRIKLFLPVALVFSGLSITTFSKGTWLLVLMGLLANGLAIYTKRRQDVKYVVSSRKSIKKYIVLLVFASITTVMIYHNQIISMVEFKIASTKDVGSLTIRENLIYASTFAALEHPLVGLGFGNFYRVEKLYPQIPLVPLKRQDNAHNIFAQTAATSGLPALVVLISIILYIIHILQKIFKYYSCSIRYGKTYFILLTLLIFLLYGSVQLQLRAQPVFWMFSGIVLGWYYSLKRGNASSFMAVD